MIKLAKIKAEWEKSLLIALVGVLWLVVIIWFWPGDREGSVNQPGALPEKPNFVDVDSEFWLQPTFLDRKISVLSFSRELPAPPTPDPPPVRPGGNRPPTTGGTVSTPAAGGQTQPPPPKTVPPKVDPPRVISILYRGMYQGLSERKLAFIKASDSSSKKSLSAPLGEGEKIFTVLTVVSFDEHSLTIMYGEGKKVVVNRGSEKKVKL